MEDIRAYIDSGILELYVLGDVSPDEKLSVAEMALKHPEVKAELDSIEEAMEGYAAELAIEPSATQRDKILNSLVVNLGDDSIFTTGKKSARVQQLPLHGKSFNYYKYAFAACFALLIVSLVALYNVYNRLQQSNTLVSLLQEKTERFSRRVRYMDNQLVVFRDDSFRFVKLKGTPKVPAAGLTVAWSPLKRKVMIDMAGMQLPANDKKHQYQLWAIVDGKPVDLGVFDASRKVIDTTAMKEMKPVSAPQAFAVTLEPKGGSVNPTMNEMVVISNI